MIRLLAVVGIAAAVGACTTTNVNNAPVEDRTTADPNAPSSAAAPGAPKMGYYTVQPGDTLIRIGLETGQSWKDIAQWNQISDPNHISVGQVLKVSASTGSLYPAPDSSAVTVTPVTPGGSSSGTSAVSPATLPAGSSTSASAAPSASGKPGAAIEGMQFMWPAAGPLLATFDEARNKGYSIGGKAGDPVAAAESGRVVYAGSGLRGYGNLIIVKHNNTYLTAYAHNQRLLVKEEQEVTKGQKIAEMGNSDADRVKLHFEIRRMGKPVDPAKYLPAR